MYILKDWMRMNEWMNEWMDEWIYLSLPQGELFIKQTLLYMNIFQFLMLPFFIIYDHLCQLLNNF